MKIWAAQLLSNQRNDQAAGPKREVRRQCWQSLTKCHMAQGRVLLSQYLRKAQKPLLDLHSLVQNSAIHLHPSRCQSHQTTGSKLRYGPTTHTIFMTRLPRSWKHCWRFNTKWRACLVTPQLLLSFLVLKHMIFNLRCAEQSCILTVQFVTFVLPR